MEELNRCIIKFMDNLLKQSNYGRADSRSISVFLKLKMAALEQLELGLITQSEHCTIEAWIDATEANL